MSLAAHSMGIYGCRSPTTLPYGRPKTTDDPSCVALKLIVLSFRFTPTERSFEIKTSLFVGILTLIELIPSPHRRCVTILSGHTVVIISKVSDKLHRSSSLNNTRNSISEYIKQQTVINARILSNITISIHNILFEIM